MAKVFRPSRSIEPSVKTKVNVNKTFDILEKTKLADATLSEYAAAHRSADNDSLREVAIRSFFNGEVYCDTTYSGIMSYQHNKIQWVFADFFKKEGFELKKETNYGFLDEIPPEMYDLEYDIQKTKAAYRRATLYYQKSEEKLVVYIYYSDHSDSYTYELHYSADKPSLWGKLNKMAEDKNLYRGKKIDPGCRFLSLKDTNWDDVILKPEVKKTISSNIDNLLNNQEALRRFGISLKRGIILHGPPGTGKTQICKAIARQVDCSVLYVLPRDFESERGGVKRVAMMAKNLAPCILIIEDIDFIAKDRQMGHAGAVIELMNYLDGLEDFGDVITIGTTNHLDTIEDAIKNRPGRFDRIINVGKPGLVEREAMIRRFTARFDMTEVDIKGSLKKLADKTEDLSGAHIRDLCNTAAANAATSGSFRAERGKDILVIKTKHFTDAIKEVSKKDYASYAEQQVKGKGFGFQQKTYGSLEDLLGDDSDF